MECSSFNKCNAPICPKLESDDIWYPSESICTQSPSQMIKAQRKIAKTKYPETYFTQEMLKRNCKITTGIKGLDPEKDEEIQLSSWLKKHKTKKILTDEEKSIMIGKMNFKNTSKQAVLS